MTDIGLSKEVTTASFAEYQILWDKAVEEYQKSGELSKNELQNLRDPRKLLENVREEWKKMMPQNEPGGLHRAASMVIESLSDIFDLIQAGLNCASVVFYL